MVSLLLLADRSGVIRSSRVLFFSYVYVCVCVYIYMYNVTPCLFDKGMRTVVVHCGYFFFPENCPMVFSLPGHIDESFILLLSLKPLKHLRMHQIVD